MYLAQPDWLFHRLYASASDAQLAAFAQAIRGPGFLSWDINYDQLEDDWFYRLVENQRAQRWRRQLSLPGARRAAKLIREASWLMYEADPPPDRALDLNAIVPVPSQVLGLGFDHPDALQWLWQHWGTTWPLRHVRQFVPTVATDSRNSDNAPLQQRWAVEFFAADWTPWPAIDRLRARFPEVTIEVSVRYGDG
jgi:hypothetical protein